MEYLVLEIAVFLGGVVSGFAGFAFSAVAGAILLHFFEPILAVPLMMFCSVASQITSLATLHRLVAWRETAPLAVGGVVGVFIAVHLLIVIDAEIFRMGFGLFLMSYAIYVLVRPAIAVLSNANGPMIHSALGLAGGLVGGLTAMPGAVPAIWCDLRGVSKERQRGMVQPFILSMQLVGIAVLLGRPAALHRELIPYVLLALPALAAGTLLGVLMFRKIEDRIFRHLVLLVLLISGCLMLGGLDGLDGPHL